MLYSESLPPRRILLSRLDLRGECSIISAEMLTHLLQSGNYQHPQSCVQHASVGIYFQEYITQPFAWMSIGDCRRSWRIRSVVRISVRRLPSIWVPGVTHASEPKVVSRPQIPVLVYTMQRHTGCHSFYYIQRVPSQIGYHRLNHLSEFIPLHWVKTTMKCLLESQYDLQAIIVTITLFLFPWFVWLLGRFFLPVERYTYIV